MFCHLCRRGLMYYGYSEHQQRLFVYATGGFEAACESSVEVPLFVGVVYGITSVDGNVKFMILY